MLTASDTGPQYWAMQSLWHLIGYCSYFFKSISFFLYGCAGCSLLAHGLLIAVASLAAEHGPQVHSLQMSQLRRAVVETWAPGLGSVVEPHRLCCLVICSIFPDQASNPGPLHWQVDP